MSSSTPAGKRVKLCSEAAQSPLGMLAALASPSPPIRNASQSLAGSLLTIAGSDSIHQTPVHSSAARFEMASTPSIDAGASNMRTPKLESGFPERSQKPGSPRSASPLYSPSTRAAKRKCLKDAQTPENDMATMDTACETAEISAQSASALSSASSVPTRSPVRPGAIPATQLDVLALVTATSPPMPSRRRWAGQSTPKPAFVRTPGATTPVRGTRETPPQRPAPSKGGGGSSSDTVSEDEGQLRSHSSRLRARHQSVRLRALPGTPPVAGGGGMGDRGARSHYTMRTYPTFYAHGQRLPSAMPGRVLAGSMARAAGEARRGRASDGESTTDDEAFVQTPVMRRAPAADVGFAAPATEPAMYRRTQQRLGAQPLGVALSKQLSELSEEAEEAEAGGNRVIHQLRDLSASLSPLPSPSRRNPRTRRMRARTTAQRPGSETETDNECELAAPLGRPRCAVGRPQYSGLAAPYHPLVANGPATPNGHGYGPDAQQLRHGSDAQQLRYSSDAQQLRLPPVSHLGGAPTPRRGAVRPPPPRAPGGGESGGDTTETDDDCFDTSRSFHYSIRPPRRVMRQLASLRSRNLPPAALDLHHAQPRQHLPAPACQPHTAPIVGSGPGASDAFGLGISGNGVHRSGGPYAGPARIVSTPMPAATASLAHAVRGHRRNTPGASSQDPCEPPGLPPARQPPAEHRPYPMHNSSMRREFARDPFAPMPDEFTYKGAALRRLERTHNRGASGGGGGEGPESLASRKRALTAPSSLEPPPLPKRSMRGSGASSPESPSDPAAPTEPRHQIGNRPGLLGESPVSSLRSSLFARAAAPSLPVSLACSSASSSSSSSSSSLSGAAARPTADGAPEPVPERNSDANESSSRKRRHSSAAARHELLQISSPGNTLAYAINPIEESPTSSSSSSSLDPAVGRSPPQSSDALFPPIDSGSN